MFSLDQLCLITFCVLITYHRFDTWTGLDLYMEISALCLFINDLYGELSNDWLIYTSCLCWCHVASINCHYCCCLTWSHAFCSLFFLDYSCTVVLHTFTSQQNLRTCRLFSVKESFQLNVGHLPFVTHAWSITIPITSCTPCLLALGSITIPITSCTPCLLALG